MDSQKGAEIDPVFYKFHPGKTHKVPGGRIVFFYLDAPVLGKGNYFASIVPARPIPSLGGMEGMALQIMIPQYIPYMVHFGKAVQILPFPIVYPLDMGKARFRYVFNLIIDFIPVEVVIPVIAVYRTIHRSS
jgi:hypothetical protein